MMGVGASLGMMDWRRAFAMGVGVSASLYRCLAREPRVPRPSSVALPLLPEMSLTEVSFPSSDGLLLSGWLLTPPQPWASLALCHGWYHNRLEPLELGLGLCQRGYQILLFDFRGCGHSQGHFSTAGFLETQDLEGAVGYLTRLPQAAGRPLGMVGISMGAAVILLSLGQGLPAQAVVLDSSFASLEQLVAETMERLFLLRPFRRWGLGLHRRLFAGAPGGDVAPQAALDRHCLPPALFIHGLEDRFIGPHHTRHLHEAYSASKELWLVPGADHGHARLNRPKEYLERVDGFFQVHLRAGGAGASAPVLAKVKASP